MNPFEKELHHFIAEEAKKALPLDGISQPLKKKLDHAAQKGELLPVIDAYHGFIKERSDIQLEKVLESEFPESAFKQLSLSSYVVPKFYQKLPRNKNAGHSHVDEVKKNFAHLPSLKRHCIDKALLSLYETIEVPKKKKVVLFTWVIPSGLGDYVAQYEAMNLLKSALPDVDFFSITVLSSQMRKKNLLFTDNAFHVFYQDEKELHVSNFSNQVKELLSSCDFVLQLPTSYPHWEELVQTLRPKSYETLGEYGFIDSQWAHPCKPHTRCMGLHFLEKGVFIKQMPSKKEAWKQIPERLQTLICRNDHVEDFLTKTDFVFAYLITLPGTLVFFHLLLTYFSSSEKDLTVGMPSLRSLLDILGRELISFSSYGISEITIGFDMKEYVYKTTSSGKQLRIVELSSLSLSESQLLCSASEDILGCRGDQSFSEAVSSDKLFYYDKPQHATPFLQDLLALAQNRLQEYPESIAFVESFLKAANHESNSNELEMLGRHMGKLLQNERAKKGLHKLNQIIKEEYSIGPVLPLIVKRSLLHGAYPDIRNKEELYMNGFLENKLSLAECLQNIRGLLHML